MCYRYRASVNQDALRDEFHAEMEIPFDQGQENLMFGFDYPDAPVILDSRPQIVTGAQWGLLPQWAKDTAFQKNTLNCKIETAAELASFKNSVNNRCLVLAEEFYEYKWEDPTKPKCKKQMYAISVPQQRSFAMAGIYSVWNGRLTFTIITTDANTLMAEIHNSKKRMPVVLHKDEHNLWLQREPLEAFKNRSELELHAVPVGGEPAAPAPPQQGSFF